MIPLALRRPPCAVILLPMSSLPLMPVTFVCQPSSTAVFIRSDFWRSLQGMLAVACLQGDWNVYICRECLRLLVCEGSLRRRGLTSLGLLIAGSSLGSPTWVRASLRELHC